jgi:hypothetical protein
VSSPTGGVCEQRNARETNLWEWPTSAWAKPALTQRTAHGVGARVVRPRLGVSEEAVGGKRGRRLHSVVSKRAAVVCSEAVIGCEEWRRGCLADRVHRALVEAAEAGMARCGVVSRPRRAGGPVCGAHSVGRKVKVGLLVHLGGRRERQEQPPSGPATATGRGRADSIALDAKERGRSFPSFRMRLTGGVWTASDFAVVPSPLVSLKSQRGASEEDPSLFRPRQALCLLMRKGDSSSVEKGI